MNSIIKDGYADVSNLLDTRNSWFNDNDVENFFPTDNTSQPYIVSVPSSGVIGGLPIGGSASIGFPVFGVDNLGNSKMMYPENDYRFKGTEVYEIPIK